MTVPASALTRAVVEIERHVAASGWDQPPRLYALVDTADLLRREPALVAQLGDGVAEAITPIEQENLPEGQPIEDALAHIGWGPDVLGCAVVLERLLLPPDAEAELQTRMDSGATEESEVADWAAQHPDREDVRIVVGVLRTGARDTALRLRSHDRDEAVLSGAELVTGLADALATTLTD